MVQRLIGCQAAMKKAMKKAAMKKAMNKAAMKKK